MNAQSFSPIRNIKKIYRFDATSTKIEPRLRLSGWSYQKNFDFTQTRRYNAKLHDPKRKKNGAALLCVEVTFE